MPAPAPRLSDDGIERWSGLRRVGCGRLKTFRSKLCHSVPLGAIPIWPMAHISGKWHTGRPTLPTQGEPARRTAGRRCISECAAGRVSEHWARPSPDLSVGRQNSTYVLWRPVIPLARNRSELRGRMPAEGGDTALLKAKERLNCDSWDLVIGMIGAPRHQWTCSDHSWIVLSATPPGRADPTKSEQLPEFDCGRVVWKAPGATNLGPTG